MSIINKKLTIKTPNGLVVGKIIGEIVYPGGEPTIPIINAKTNTFEMMYIKNREMSITDILPKAAK